MKYFLYFSLLILPDAGPDVKYFLYFRLLILPDAGPDVKYFLGFLRTQLSTTIILILVFGPKVTPVTIFLQFNDLNTKLLFFY